MGCGIFAEYSRILVPSPPQNSTTFIFLLPGIDDGEVGNGDYELASPFSDMSHLPHDFLLQIPRQNQNVIRSRLVDHFRRVDGNVHPRREPAMLVGIAIDGKFQEVRPDSAVVEQRVSLTWRAISTDDLALVLRTDQI